MPPSNLSVGGMAWMHSFTGKSTQWHHTEHSANQAAHVPQTTAPYFSSISDLGTSCDRSGGSLPECSRSLLRQGDTCLCRENTAREQPDACCSPRLVRSVQSCLAWPSLIAVVLSACTAKCTGTRHSALAFILVSSSRVQSSLREESLLLASGSLSWHGSFCQL